MGRERRKYRQENREKEGNYKKLLRTAKKAVARGMGWSIIIRRSFELLRSSVAKGDFPRPRLSSSAWIPSTRLQLGCINAACLRPSSSTADTKRTPTRYDQRHLTKTAILKNRKQKFEKASAARVRFAHQQQQRRSVPSLVEGHGCLVS